MVIGVADQRALKVLGPVVEIVAVEFGKPLSREILCNGKRINAVGIVEKDIFLFCDAFGGQGLLKKSFGFRTFHLEPGGGEVFGLRNVAASGNTVKLPPIKGVGVSSIHDHPVGAFLCDADSLGIEKGRRVGQGADKGFKEKKKSDGGNLVVSVHENETLLIKGDVALQEEHFKKRVNGSQMDRFYGMDQGYRDKL